MKIDLPRKEVFGINIITVNEKAVKFGNINVVFQYIVLSILENSLVMLRINNE